MDTINKIQPATLEQAFELRPAQSIAEISLYESRINNDTAHHSNYPYFVPGTNPTETEPREQVETEQKNIENQKKSQESDSSLQRIEVHQENNPIEEKLYEHKPFIEV